MVIQSIDSQKCISLYYAYFIFSKHKSEIEELEYCASYNMPIWSENNPEKFWYAADQYTSETRRTSSHITIALPKELDKIAV